MNKEYYSVRRIGDDEEAYLAHANGFKYLSKKWVNGAWRYIYDVTGLGARDRRDAANVNLRAQQQANRSRRQSGATYGVQTLRSARNKANAAQKAYDNTLAGRAEKAFKGASKAVSRTVGSAQKALSNLTGKATKAVNSYKAQQNSKRIAKKVSKKNAEFKKQQLEKIEKGKDKNYRSYESAKNDAMRARRLANKYGDDISVDSYPARQASHAKSLLNLKRAKPKNEKYMRDWRKGKLQEERTRSVRGGNNIVSPNAFRDDYFDKTKPITYKSKKAKKELREAFKKDLNTPMQEAKRPSVTKRTPLHLVEGDRYGLKRPERARWGMSRADWVKYDIKNYTTQNKRKRKGPVLSRRTRDARYSSR